MPVGIEYPYNIRIECAHELLIRFVFRNETENSRFYSSHIIVGISVWVVQEK